MACFEHDITCHCNRGIHMLNNVTLPSFDVISNVAFVLFPHFDLVQIKSQHEQESSLHKHTQLCIRLILTVLEMEPSAHCVFYNCVYCKSKVGQIPKHQIEAYQMRLFAQEEDVGNREGLEFSNPKVIFLHRRSR